MYLSIFILIGAAVLQDLDFRSCCYVQENQTWRLQRKARRSSVVLGEKEPLWHFDRFDHGEKVPEKNHWSLLY